MTRSSEHYRALADRGFVDSLRWQTRWAQAAELLDSSHLIAAASGLRLPPGVFNGAVRTDSALDSARFLDEVSDWFAARRAAFSVYIRGELDEDLELACASRGFIALEPMPVLVLSTPPPTVPLDPELSLEIVQSAELVADFAAVAATAYQSSALTAQAVRSLLSASDALLCPEVRLLLVRRAGRAIAGALSLASPGITGIYWVGTTPDARGRGVASHATRALCAAAFAEGADATVVQAAPGVQRLYEKLGFERIGTLRRMCWPFARHRAGALPNAP